MPESGVEPVPAPVGAKNRDLRKTGLHPDYWHPVARSKALKRGKAIGVTFAGEPIVLVRPNEGAVFALEDRCAHRQVPLHVGVVCPQGLQCCYHGWTYDATGRCVSVPYLGKDKTKPNGVRSYPCREAYGLVFVFPGDAALAACRIDAPADRLWLRNNPKKKRRKRAASPRERAAFGLPSGTTVIVERLANGAQARIFVDPAHHHNN